jgi:hypothetical protein
MGIQEIVASMSTGVSLFDVVRFKNRNVQLWDLYQLLYPYILIDFRHIADCVVSMNSNIFTTPANDHTHRAFPMPPIGLNGIGYNMVTFTAGVPERAGRQFSTFDYANMI